MIRTPGKAEKRTAEQLREHYEVERELAARLRNAPKQERRTLYASLYEELYRLVPHHSQITRKISPEQQKAIVKKQVKVLENLLDKNVSFLEVGPGDCSLAFEIAKSVKKVYAVDVSKTITEASEIPPNFELFLSDGCSIPVPKNSIDVIYSNQLMEHLHPDDAYDQLKNIFEALAPGGVYFCITPNRLNGPHDISRYFDTVATGFHLKEYTVGELSKLFKKVGFSKVILYIGAKGKYVRFPIFPAVFCERLLEPLPNSFRWKLAHSRLIGALISIRLIGVKNDTS